MPSFSVQNKFGLAGNIFKTRTIAWQFRRTSQNYCISEKAIQLLPIEMMDKFSSSILFLFTSHNQVLYNLSNTCPLILSPFSCSLNFLCFSIDFVKFCHKSLSLSQCKHVPLTKPFLPLLSVTSSTQVKKKNCQRSSAARLFIFFSNANEDICIKYYLKSLLGQTTAIIFLVSKFKHSFRDNF